MNAGIIQSVDPTTLIVAANVRKDTKLTKAFVASIKEHGVMVPITAQMTAEGLAVIDGQRRTLAAVDAGAKTVPVYVVAPVKDDGVRIVDQLVINGERESMSAAEIVTAVSDLSLFGMSSTVIAKKTGIAKGEVETALKVAGSEVATHALQTKQVSFMDAAALVEFEGYPDYLKTLMAYIERGDRLEHIAQRFRDEITDAQGKAAVIEEIESAGIVMLPSAPSYDDPKHVRSDQLYTGPKHSTAVALDVVLAEAGDDLRAYPSKEWGGWDGDTKVPSRWVVGYAVANWAEHGWFSDAYKNGNTGAPAKTEEQKAVDRAARESTKIWKSATAVRVTWLRELLTRKTPPKGWEYVVATWATGGDAAAWGGVLEVLELTHSGDNYSRRGTVDRYLHEHPTRSWAIVLGVALGTVEGGFEFDRKGWQQRHAPAYLRQLADWGYTLSEQEQGIVDGAKAAAAA